MTARRDFDARRALRHPLWWGAAGLLALNDHVLKGAGLLPEIVTGKLSDAAGLLVAPVLLAVVLRARTGRALAACHLAPVVALAMLKLSPPFAASVVALAAAFGETWAIVADPTDLLVAIPAALASWWWLARPARSAGDAQRGSASLRAREIVLVSLAALACGATSRSAPQAPAIDRGRVVAGPWGEGETYVIDKSGRAIRKLDVWSGDPPVVFRGALWTIPTDGGTPQIVATELDTGRERKMAMPRGVSASEVGALDAQSLYVRGYCDPSVCGHTARWTAIDLATGAVRWQSAADWGASIVVGENVAALTEGARLVVRDVSGAVLYTKTFGHRASALALANGVLWVGDAGGTLLALGARDGALRGSWELGERASGMAPEGGAARHRAAADGDRLYLALSDGVVAVAVGSSRPVWEKPGRSVAATTGVVVIETADGHLAGLEPATGRMLWQSSVAWMWSGYAVGDGIVARRDGDPYVVILDARTGRQLAKFDLDDGEPASD